MTIRKIIFSVLLILFITPQAFSQPEVLKGVVNSLARYKKNKELKYLASAKKSIDSLIAVNNDTTNFEKNIYLAVVNSSVLYADSLNSLSLPQNLLSRTTRLFDKLNEHKKKAAFQNELTYIADCLANIYIRSGFDYLKKSDLITAQQYFLMARKYAPRFDHLDAYLGHVNLRLGNLTAAATFYSRMSAKTDIWTENIESALAVYKAIGDTLKAVSLLKRARTLSKDNPSLLLDEANIYNNKRDYVSLEPLLPTLLENYGDNSDVLFVAANCYDRLGKHNKAEALYLKAIELNGSAYEPIFNLGLLFLKKAQIEGIENGKNLTLAARWLEKAHEIIPSNLGNLEALRLLYNKTGNTIQLDKINNKLKQLTN